MLLLGGLVAVCVALAGLVLTTRLTVAIACCVLFGYGMILFFATGQTAVQLGTADADRGKVMGVWAMMLSAGVPLGNLVFGPAADAVGITRVIAVQAGIMAVAAGVLDRPTGRMIRPIPVIFAPASRSAWKNTCASV